LLQLLLNAEFVVQQMSLFWPAQITGKASACCVTAKHTIAAATGMLETSKEAEAGTRAGVCGWRAGCAAEMADTWLGQLYVGSSSRAVIQNSRRLGLFFR